MYTLEALFKDVAQKRGGVKGGGAEGVSPAEYAEVWNSYCRYLKACLEQRRGLQLNVFCKVGWLATKKRNSSDYRPFFMLTEQFCRSCNMPAEAIRRNLKAPAGELCQFEDFNFSKASIKYSNQLTKDQVFSALRAIVTSLHEAVSSGKEISVAFADIGILRSRPGEAKDLNFAFSQDFCAQHGVDYAATLRPGSAASGVEAPVAAFRKNAPAEAQSMAIVSGAAAAAARPSEPMVVPLSAPEPEEPFLDYPPRTPSPRHAPAMSPEQGRSGGFGGGGLNASASAPSLTAAARSPTANLTSAQYKKEVAYKEAMDRHICAMESAAAEAIAERHAMQQHMDACLEQERDEITGKRTRAQMNLHYLKHQIQMGEEKKRSQRKEDIAAASAHDFPVFGVAEKSGSKEFMLEQQAKMRGELDDQVKTANTLKNLAKQRERTMEINQLNANKEEMAVLRNAERAKRAYDREALATAWNSDIRMKNIWKAIDSHSKVGSQNPSHAPQVLPIDGLPPPSRGGCSSVASAGRLLTGNSRRVPLGASMSLSRLQG